MIHIQTLEASLVSYFRGCTTYTTRQHHAGLGHVQGPSEVLQSQHEPHVRLGGRWHQHVRLKRVQGPPDVLRHQHGPHVKLGGRLFM